AVERQVERPLMPLLERVSFGLVSPQIPLVDTAGPVLALGNRPLELQVPDGVVLHLDRQALHRRIERGPLGDGPALEHTAHLQPKVVVEAGGVMLLHHEPAPDRWAGSLLTPPGGRIRLPLVPVAL